MQDKDTIIILMKKWELLLNQYILQDNLHEKRRGFLWLLQAISFASFYYVFIKLNDYSIFIYFAKIAIPIWGLFISFLMLVVLKRHSKRLLLGEQALRDTEEQMRLFNNKLIINRFTVDKAVFNENRCHTWPHSKEYYIAEESAKFKSSNFWMNVILPYAFIITWIIIIIIAISHVGRVLLGIHYFPNIAYYLKASITSP